MTTGNPLVIGYLSSSNSIHDSRFLQKLSELHRRTCFITFAPEAPAYLHDLPGVEVHRLHDPRWQLEDPANPAYALHTRLKLRVAMHLLATRLARLLQEQQVDLLHAGWLGTDGFVAALSGFHPLLVMPWGSDVLLLDQGWRRGNRMRVRRAIEAADAITCDADIVRRRMLELTSAAGEREILQMPWGIDLQQFRPPTATPPPGRPLRVVCIKALISNSDHATLIEAVARLPEPVTVEAYGEGPLRQDLEALARERGVDGTVTFHGHLPNHRCAEVLGQADLYVACSRSEGTSLAMMEAMACGTPVLVTDLPAYRQWVDEGVHGYRYAPGDAGALAACLQRAAADRPGLQRMGAAGLAVARRSFDWDRNFESLQGLYERMVKRWHSRR